MKNSSLIFSKGILNIPFLKQFLVDENIVPFSFFNNGSKINRVIGWGLKPTADRARKYAAKHHLPYIALEDGFLRSLGLGVNKYPTFSLVYDDLGIYYDTTKPSRLEMLILNFETNEKQLKEAENAKNLIVQYQLSKYNHALDFVHECSNHRHIVLVIDQTFGDMAVHYGQANEQDFQYMLQSAVDENPEVEIWVKTHPDVLSKKKQGYLTTIAQHQRVTLLAKDVNPMSLLAYADTVYCVTSQMGFEALLLNKKVVTFGVPWFAGWGLTDDRHPQVSTLIAQHRHRPRSLLTLFSAILIPIPINQVIFLMLSGIYIKQKYSINYYKEIFTAMVCLGGNRQ
ncbi:capsule polysaccharide modification protein [Actinobacillus seminis]|uniref:Capsule polysaccharide modification protein n=1 Tax=Actinobacillus seminis TaxID=722 RepID=A0A380V8L9_9PAST|nr:hypothetical protein [Actinobacillus seminis]SUU33986.1 capsule polysaccharide modification protein [Actinobacillus seminis]